MVSTLTQEGAKTTLQALELGAFDYVGKPASADLAHAFDDLGEKVKAAAQEPRARSRAAAGAGARVQLPLRTAASSRSARRPAASRPLITVLSAMPENCPPTRR